MHRQPDLNSAEREKIRAHLLTIVCSPAWADSILATLSARDRNGRPTIRHKVDRHGRLCGDIRSKMPRLLAAIAQAGIYPPPADDRASEDGVHVGSAMKPCLCRECTRVNPDGSVRHVHWPASYMVADHLSYTCRVNLAAMRTDLIEEINPQSQLLESGRQSGRGVSVRDAAEQLRVDDDAWRSDTLKHLRLFAQRSACELDAPQLLLLEDPGLLCVLKKFRWSEVIGQVSIDSRTGREISGVRRRIRHLKNVGSIVDYLDLGHDLAAIPGVSIEDAESLKAIIDAYPRNPALRQPRIKWQKVRT